MGKLTSNMVDALKSARFIKSDADRKIIAEDGSFESFTGWAILGMDGRTRTAMHKRGYMHGHYYLTQEGVEIMRTVRDDVPAKEEKAEAFCAMHNCGISQCSERHNNDSDSGFRETEDIPTIPAKKSSFPAATPQDTEMHFIGSGAIGEYWWWFDISLSYPIVGRVAGEDVPDDWSITGTFGDVDDDTAKAFTVDHASILRAIRAIAKLDPMAEAPARKYVSGWVIKECRTWVFKGPDECDFDAAMADEVIQYAVAHSVVYG